MKGTKQTTKSKLLPLMVGVGIILGGSIAGPAQAGQAEQSLPVIVKMLDALAKEGVSKPNCIQRESLIEKYAQIAADAGKKPLSQPELQGHFFKGCPALLEANKPARPTTPPPTTAAQPQLPSAGVRQSVKLPPAAPSGAPAPQAWKPAAKMQPLQIGRGRTPSPREPEEEVVVPPPPPRDMPQVAPQKAATGAPPPPPPPPMAAPGVAKPPAARAGLLADIQNQKKKELKHVDPEAAKEEKKAAQAADPQEAMQAALAKALAARRGGIKPEKEAKVLTPEERAEKERREAEEAKAWE